MTLRSLFVFIHVVSAMGVFGALAIEGTLLSRLRRADGTADMLDARIVGRRTLAAVSGEAIKHSFVSLVRDKRPVPWLTPHGGRFGLPADFLIAPDGRVPARKYGIHADDQWSVEAVLTLAREAAPQGHAVPSSPRPPAEPC